MARLKIQLDSKSLHPFIAYFELVNIRSRRLFQWLALGLAALVAYSAGGAEAASPLMAADSPAAYDSPTNGLGSWIWTGVTTNQQPCHLWKAFVIPEGSPIVKARLVMTVDNEFTLFLDGRELGRGAEWRELFVFDLTKILTPGRHVLAVSAYNDSSFAGMLFGLRVTLADGRNVEVKSDPTWRIVPEDMLKWVKLTRAADAWPYATIIAPLGSVPWWTQPQNVNVMPSQQQIKVHFWQTGWFQVTLLTVCVLVILLSFRLMTQLAFHKGERWLLQRERARIARDIHDDIGPRMTMLVLHGEEAQNGFPEGSERNLHLVRICEEARGLLATMDEILWAVNPRRDTMRDFTAYVCTYAEAFLESAQIHCLFVVDPEMSMGALNLPFRRSLLMAIKEALNNAVKHSGASEVRIQIQLQGQRLVVSVQDNGLGFAATTPKPERNGLSNMARRVGDLGGTCHVVSEPGKGCRVEFSVPLTPPRRYPWTRLWNSKLYSDQPGEMKSTSPNDSAQNHDPANC